MNNDLQSSFSQDVELADSKITGISQIQDVLNPIVLFESASKIETSELSNVGPCDDKLSLAAGSIFLSLCGIVVPHRDSGDRKRILQMIWNMLIVLGAIAPVLLFLVLLTLETPSDKKAILANFLTFAALVCQVSGILLGWWRNIHRSCDHVPANSLNISTVTAIFMILVSTFVEAGQDRDYFLAGVVYAPLCLLTSGNLCFTLADALISQREINRLIALTNAKKLTLTDARTVRETVKRIQHASHFASWTLIGPALFNLVTMFALFLMFPSEVVISDTVIFFREFIVGAVCLYNVGLVNEAGAILTETVEEQMFSNESIEASVRKEAGNILLSLQSNPIRYSIAGMVLTRKDVAFRFSLYVFGVVLSIVTKAI